MTAQVTQHAHVSRQGEGQAYWFLGSRVTVKASGAMTRG